MVDERLTIVAAGLDAGSKVTVRSQVNEGRFKFEAHAHYVADQRGEIHLTEQASLGGSYTGLLLLFVLILSALFFAPLSLKWYILPSFCIN